MDEALLRILLVSDGAVMALKVRTTGTRDATSPTSDLARLIDSLDKRYEACRTHRKRLELIKEAQRIANNLRYAPKADVIGRGTKEWRQKLASDPRPQRVVASDRRVSSREISAARKEFPELVP